MVRPSSLSSSLSSSSLAARRSPRSATPHARLLAALLSFGALGAGGCNDYNLAGEKEAPGRGEGDTGTPGEDWTEQDVPPDCKATQFPAEEVGVGDSCPTPPEGTFNPIVEWDYGDGWGCLSQPIVADMDADGKPEVVVNILKSFFNPPGVLTVLHGDGSGLIWEDTGAIMAYGSPPAVADLDDDGYPEIVIVREYASALFGAGDYTAAAYDNEGNELWESEHFIDREFDWASAPVIRDMNHDGDPEIVIGRVIFNHDGTVRGVGQYGRGSYGLYELGDFVVGESAVPAVTDLNLDGEDEVVVGNAIYDIDGNATWFDDAEDDGMISIANLDADPEGEFVAITGNTIRAVDTDGTILWGPTVVDGANILATAGIADLDLDGLPELVTAGGNRLVVFNHDGTVLWSTHVTDTSGATGASFFDFEGDGVPEVVYIDEVEMAVYDGPTGALKFFNDEHASNTMFDYPTVADVDADDHAEIIVCHNSFSSALSVYGDVNDSWMPARKVWNQHAYDITNINDDLSVPLDPTPGFADTNTWHSAIATTGESLVNDVSAEILEICEDDCDQGYVWVTARALNYAAEDLEAGLHVALYGRSGGVDSYLADTVLEAPIRSGWSSEGLVFHVEADLLDGADSLWFAADDDGTGTGALLECAETNNGFQWNGPFCAG